MNADIQNFLQLPDWKKMILKIDYSKFNSYPIQTKEQELSRSNAIYSLCAHFAMKDTDEFLMDLANPLGDVWPRAMELFVTPTLLDHINIDALTQFGYCQFCENYAGYKKLQPRQWLRKNKKQTVVPIYGRCHLMDLISTNTYLSDNDTKNKKHLSSAFSHVSVYHRCSCWNPVSLVEKLIEQKIKNLFTIGNFPYYYDDYVKDLHLLNLWDFLQNRYRVNKIS